LQRRKFVADGVFYAELNEFFQRELAEEGYSGVEVRVTPTVPPTSSSAPHTPRRFLESRIARIRELTSLIQKRFRRSRELRLPLRRQGSEPWSLRRRPVRVPPIQASQWSGRPKGFYGVLRFIMESGAKGCEVVVSGKLQGRPCQEHEDSFMIHSGQPAKDFIDHATRHVLLRQGVLGIKVKIMRGSDPEGKAGPSKTLPDSVTIIEPKEEQPVVQPMSQDYGAKAIAAQQAAEQARQAEQGEGEAQPAGGEGYSEEQ
ncbi:unnamed protein product, partial [Alternaria alternata]